MPNTRSHLRQHSRVASDNTSILPAFSSFTLKSGCCLQRKKALLLLVLCFVLLSACSMERWSSAEPPSYTGGTPIHYIGHGTVMSVDHEEHLLVVAMEKDSYGITEQPVTFDYSLNEGRTKEGTLTPGARIKIGYFTSPDGNGVYMADYIGVFERPDG